ncbi:hypothetical protein H4Q26_010440 [Puccinia striiformis f. sp. tritici PST-130]|nr:hypothetical protein H4Q26_010440 [Puccinia striiformis f. sp. tritici PST-130]
MSSPNQSNQNSAMNNQNLPKNLSLTTANSNPLHQTTPTLGLFTNSQSLASPNLLGFNKSNFQTFARVAAPVTNHPISRSGFADKETINQENEDQSITQPEDNLIESKDELTDSKKNRVTYSTQKYT